MKYKSLLKFLIFLSVFTFSNYLFADEYTLIEKTVESANYKNIDINTFKLCI